MKNAFILAVLAALIATSSMANSIANSKHDMITSGFADDASGGTEICVFCHTPHGAQISVTQAPLWNNTAVNSVSASVYQGVKINFGYDQAKINATDARLCLACHDGGVGMPVNEPNGSSIAISTTVLMSANALLSTDMSNDHPIGMDLGANPENPVTGDAGIHTIPYITAVGTGFGGNPFYGGAAVNTMWCSSCHNVHDNVNVPFLRKNNAGSNLCKVCHIK